MAEVIVPSDIAGMPSTGVKPACIEALRERTTCPGCGKVLSRHALLYKHQCKFDSTKAHLLQTQRAAERQHTRINKRIETQERMLAEACEA